MINADIHEDEVKALIRYHAADAARWDKDNPELYRRAVQGLSYWKQKAERFQPLLSTAS